MTGSVDACNVESAQIRQNSNQQSLHSFGEDTEETFVSIVHSANDDIDEVCDEHDDRLAPHQDLFTDWISTRDELRGQESYTVAHNEAFYSVNYRTRFLATLDDDVIEEYAERVRDGEHIVFVCFCRQGCMCHRNIVKNLVHKKINE